MRPLDQQWCCEGGLFIGVAMQKVDPNRVSEGEKVIYLDPTKKEYFYATISRLDKHYYVIHFPKANFYKRISYKRNFPQSLSIAYPVYYRQLYYDNPENRTEALLNNITIY